MAEFFTLIKLIFLNFRSNEPASFNWHVLIYTKYDLIFLPLPSTPRIQNIRQ